MTRDVMEGNHYARLPTAGIDADRHVLPPVGRDLMLRACGRGAA